jgi:hypothetical protein
MKDQTHNQLGTVVGLSTRGALGEVATTSRWVYVDGSIKEGNTYRGSSTPHHTPMPATDPSCPFPEHAPSVYTTSSAVADVLDGPATCNFVLDGSGAVCVSDSDWPGVARLTVDEDEDTDTRPPGRDPMEGLSLSSKWYSGFVFCLTGYGTACCIQASASSRDLIFLYFAQG